MRTQLNNAPELEKMALKAGVSPDAANTLAQWYHNTKDKSKLADFMETMRAEAPNPYIQKFRESVLAEEPAINKAWESFNAPGSLYKVDLPDEQIAKMLDWDKPLSEQAPEIQELARNLDISNAIGRNKGVMQAWREGRDVGITPRGEHLYESLSGSGKYQPQASQTLYEAGIPGIQYLDQSSRNQAQRFIARSPQGGESVFNSAEEAQQFIENMAKRGHEFEYVDPNLTRNYVVFSDEIPQILERNNIPVNK